jgi:uncharacterized protein (TIGR02145 family)
VNGLEWMAEDLNLGTVVTGNALASDGSQKWCYGNDDKHCDAHGGLYTWKAAMNVCPSGWRLPSKDEWDDLMRTFSNNRTKLNEAGFNGNLNGYRNASNQFVKRTEQMNYWSATSTSQGEYGHIWTSYDRLNQGEALLQLGLGVRCVRGNLINNSVTPPVVQPPVVNPPIVTPPKAQINSWRDFIDSDKIPSWVQEVIDELLLQGRYKPKDNIFDPQKYVSMYDARFFVDEVFINGPGASFQYPEEVPVTRAEFAQLVADQLMRFGTIPLPVDPIFSDVDASHPYFEGVQLLAKYDLMRGYPNGDFNEAGFVARAELLKVLYDAQLFSVELEYNGVIGAVLYSDKKSVVNKVPIFNSGTTSETSVSKARKPKKIQASTQKRAPIKSSLLGDMKRSYRAPQSVRTQRSSRSNSIAKVESTQTSVGSLSLRERIRARLTAKRKNKIIPSEDAMNDGSLEPLSVPNKIEPVQPFALNTSLRERLRARLATKREKKSAAIESNTFVDSEEIFDVEPKREDIFKWFPYENLRKYFYSK